MIYVNESNYYFFDLLENYLSRDYENYFTKDTFVNTSDFGVGITKIAPKC